MPRRHVDITAELLVAILKGFTDGPPRYFEVIRDPVPADAGIVSVESIGNDVVRIVLESEQFEDTWAPLTPTVRIVEAPGVRFREFL